MRFATWFAALAASVVALAAPALALDEEAVRQRADAEVARELTDCAAFYLIRLEFMRSGGRNNYILMTANMIDQMAQRAEKLMSPEAVQARVKAAALRMLDEMGRDLGKMSMLNEKYGAACHEVYAQPDQRVAYWVDVFQSGGPAGGAPAGDQATGPRPGGPRPDIP
jgi:hypothetical protein